MDISFLCNLKSATPCTFQKGEYLFRQGEKQQYVYFLKNGIVERIEYNEAGIEVLYNTKSANSRFDTVVGLSNLWQKDHLIISDFIAKTSLECIRINANEAKESLSQHPDILGAMLTLSIEKYVDLRELFNAHHKRHIPNHLCKKLINLSSLENGKFVIPKKVTNVTLSKQLGVHLVTIAKIMSYLQKSAILERTPSGLRILNMEKLSDFAYGERVPYLDKIPPQFSCNKNCEQEDL